MPSQDDNLDKMMGEKRTAIDSDAIKDMSEKEIEKLLAIGREMDAAEDVPDVGAEEQEVQEDLLQLDKQEIQGSLLQQNDFEAVERSGSQEDSESWKDMMQQDNSMFQENQEEQEIQESGAELFLQEDESFQVTQTDPVGQKQVESPDLQEEDVLDMLDGTDDSDLREIQELLRKSDNNEPVSDGAEETEIRDFGELMGMIDEPEKVDKKQRALDKKRKRKEKAEAKKAAKRAARDARTAAREAEKIARAAEKEAEKAEKKASEGKSDQKEDGDLFSNNEEYQNQNPEGEEPEMSGAEEKAESEIGVDELEKIIGAQFGDEPEEGQQTDSEFDMNSILEDTDVDVDLLAGDAANAEGTEPEEDIFAASDVMDEFIEDVSSDIEEEEPKPEERKSFFSRVMNLLTEEDEEDEIKLSDENKEILKGAGKGAKKTKKAKPKKEKKAKPQKAAKPKKPKKEKPAKEPEAPGKKLSFKKVIPVILVGISVGVLLFVYVNASAEYVNRKAAKDAFDAGDYQTCYQNLFGKELNESEEFMFGKAKSILYIKIRLREYETYLAENSQVRALDALIRAVNQYPELYNYASRWNAATEVRAEYEVILTELSERFGLTEDDAREIAAQPRDVEYTKIVTAIAQGQGYGSGSEPEPEEADENQPLEDQLPEEDEMGQDTFIDNQ